MTNMTLLAVLLAVSVWMFELPQTQTPPDVGAQAPVFRDPFTLKLRVDSERYYEEHFDKIPYVEKDDVYLFSGETFGINATIAGDEISGVTYQKNATKADVEFKFTQELNDNKAMMTLVVRNKLKHRLFYDALMTVPEKKEIYKTSVLPVEPGLFNVESWPHPIVQLVLRHFRFSDKVPKAKK